MRGSTPQAMRSSWRWAAACQGWRPLNASWVSSISPRPRRKAPRQVLRGLPVRSYFRPGSGCSWRAGNRPAGELGPDPAAAGVQELGDPVGQGAAAAEPAAVKLVLVAAVRAGKGLREVGAAGADRGPVAGSAAGKRTILTAPRADARTCTARSRQVRQTWPSGQLPALYPRRPHSPPAAWPRRYRCRCQWIRGIWREPCGSVSGHGAWLPLVNMHAEPIRSAAGISRDQPEPAGAATGYRAWTGCLYQAGS